MGWEEKWGEGVGERGGSWGMEGDASYSSSSPFSLSLPGVDCIRVSGGTVRVQFDKLSCSGCTLQLGRSHD